jgi:hypothetical protein
MTKIIGVTPTNDFLIDETGNLVILDGLSAVMGACACTAKAQRGEMIRAVSKGIPNMNVTWVGSPNLVQLEAALRAAWAAVDGVRRVVSFEATRVRDTISYIAVIETVYGVATLTEQG